MQTINTRQVMRNTDWQPVEAAFEDGVTMVLVPAGCFTMGDEPLTEFEVCFDAPFWLDKTEVVRADYSQLLGLQNDIVWETGTPQMPVNNITWFDARDFCITRGATLPTEAQWEYAARGVDSLIYPWGDDTLVDNLIHNRDASEGVAEVGTIPAGASWVGALDMAGNLEEWTSSLYSDYPYNAGDGREIADGFGERVGRGGSWESNNPDLVRSATRTSYEPVIASSTIGFRCARAMISPRAIFTVTVQSINLRTGPGTMYAVAGAAKRGDTFPIIAQHNEWYLVETADERFVWVANTLGDFDNPTGATIEPAKTVPPTPRIPPTPIPPTIAPTADGGGGGQIPPTSVGPTRVGPTNTAIPTNIISTNPPTSNTPFLITASPTTLDS
jgi:hypothetical protein